MRVTTATGGAFDQFGMFEPSVNRAGARPRNFWIVPLQVRQNRLCAPMRELEPNPENVRYHFRAPPMRPAVGSTRTLAKSRPARSEERSVGKEGRPRRPRS